MVSQNTLKFKKHTLRKGEYGRRRRRRRHLEVQVRKLCLEFSNWVLTHMRALISLIPGLYNEFRAGSI